MNVSCISSANGTIVLPNFVLVTRRENCLGTPVFSPLPWNRNSPLTRIHVQTIRWIKLFCAIYEDSMQGSTGMVAGFRGQSQPFGTLSF